MADAKLLVDHGVDRHVLAAKLDAVLLLGNKGRAISEASTAIVQRELGINANDAAALAAFPVHAVVCATAGHHNDVSAR